MIVCQYTHTGRRATCFEVTAIRQPTRRKTRIMVTKFSERNDD